MNKKPKRLQLPLLGEDATIADYRRVQNQQAPEMPSPEELQKRLTEINQMMIRVARSHSEPLAKKIRKGLAQVANDFANSIRRLGIKPVIRTSDKEEFLSSVEAIWKDSAKTWGEMMQGKNSLRFLEGHTSSLENDISNFAGDMNHDEYSSIQRTLANSKKFAKLVQQSICTKNRFFHD